VSVSISPRPSSSTTTPTSVSALSSPNERMMNQVNKGKIWLKDHPQGQITYGNTMRRITRS